MVVFISIPYAQSSQDRQRSEKPLELDGKLQARGLQRHNSKAELPSLLSNPAGIIPLCEKNYGFLFVPIVDFD